MKQTRSLFTSLVTVIKLIPFQNHSRYLRVHQRGQDHGLSAVRLVAGARDADPCLLLAPPHDPQLLRQLRRLLSSRPHLQVRQIQQCSVL